MKAARAEIGILGGTGLYEWPGLEDVADLDIETPYGPPSSRVRVGSHGGRRIAFLARHGPGHRLLPHEIPFRANVWALRSLGVQKAVSASAVGSLREALAPRTLIVPDQYIDRTRHRSDTFFGDGLVAHVSLAEPFSAEIRGALLAGARASGLSAKDGGTYLCMEGPQFSTRAESRWYRQMGCDIIGMTGLTEARLCREAEIAYAALCMVTDYDAWREEEAAVTAADILAILADNAQHAAAAIREAIPRVPEGLLPDNRVLDHALVTPLAEVPAETRARLEPLLARHARAPL